MSMMEHLSAYSAFDNGGFRISPHPVLKVLDKKGQVLEAFDRQPSREKVISPEVAYVMTDLLKGPPKLSLGWSNPAQPVAAKSGTTESWTGSTWIGYTPDLAVATYMAHINLGDQCNSGYARLAQGFAASGWLCPTNVVWGEYVGSSVWKPFLLDYYKSRPWPAAWAQPAGVVTMGVCRSDGSLAGDAIPGDQKYQEIFIKAGGLPNTTCAPPTPVPATPSPLPTVLPSRSPSPPPRS